jgi:translation initiation factor 2 alpha subunit (eIF-2alpha)
MAEDDINRINNYSNIIFIMIEWLKYITNKQNTEFNKNIDKNLWMTIMTDTVWKYNKSEIFEVFLNISNGKNSFIDVFSDFYQKIIDKHYDFIELIDLNIFEQFIKNTLKNKIYLNIKLKLISLSINSVEKIKEICNCIQNKLHSDGYIVKLDITCPIYEFSITDKDKEKIENYHSNLENKITYLLNKFDDIEYHLEMKIIY